MRTFPLVIALTFLPAACAAPAPSAPGPAASAAIERGVRRMMDDIPPALAGEGPDGWLRFFEDGPDFYMVSDGQVLFPGIDAARRFIAEFAPTVASMTLTWSNMRIDPAAADLALVAATYQETIMDTGGTELLFTGAFTAVAVRTPTGWRLRTLHWSSTPRE